MPTAELKNALKEGLLTQKQYDKLPGFVKNYIYGELSKEQNLEIDEKYMTHKSFINKIRS